MIKWMSPLVVVLVVLIYQCDAKNYVVGKDDFGWAITSKEHLPYYPANEKNVKAGDTLEFNSIIHNVVKVLDKPGYDKCTTTKGYTEYPLGKNTITLVKGMNYFITTTKPAACKTFGMKIKVEAK